MTKASPSFSTERPNDRKHLWSSTANDTRIPQVRSPSSSQCTSPQTTGEKTGATSVSPVSVADLDVASLGSYEVFASEENDEYDATSSLVTQGPIPQPFMDCIIASFGPQVDLYHDVFGVPSNVSERELKVAYLRMGSRAVLSEPNPQSNAVESSPHEISRSKFQAISMAYQILRQPAWREYYHEHGLSATPSPSAAPSEPSPANGTLVPSASKTSLRVGTSILRLGGRTKDQALPQPKIRWKEHVEELIYTQDEDERCFKLGTNNDCDDHQPSRGSSRKNKKKVWLEARDLGDQLERINESCEPSFVSNLLSDLERSLDGLEASVDSFMGFSWSGQSAKQNLSTEQNISSISHYADDELDSEDSVTTTTSSVSSLHDDQQDQSVSDEEHVLHEPSAVEQYLQGSSSMIASVVSSIEGPTSFSDSSSPSENDRSVDHLRFEQQLPERAFSSVKALLEERRSRKVSDMLLSTEVDKPGAFLDDSDEKQGPNLATLKPAKAFENSSVEKEDDAAQMFASLTKTYKDVLDENSIFSGQTTLSADDQIVKYEYEDDSPLETPEATSRSSRNLTVPRYGKEYFSKNFSSDPWNCLNSSLGSPSQQDEHLSDHDTNIPLKQAVDDSIAIPLAAPNDRDRVALDTYQHLDRSHDELLYKQIMTPTTKFVRYLPYKQDTAAVQQDSIADESKSGFCPFGDGSTPPLADGKDASGPNEPHSWNVVVHDDCGVTVSTISASETASAISSRRLTEFIDRAQPDCDLIPILENSQENSGRSPSLSAQDDGNGVRAHIFFTSDNHASASETHAIEINPSFATNDSDVLLLDGAASAVSSLTGKPSVVSASMPSCPYIFAPRMENRKNPGKKDQAEQDPDFSARLMSFVSHFSEEVARLGESLSSILGFGVTGGSETREERGIDAMLDKAKRSHNVN